jgi:hypothetical protein
MDTLKQYLQLCWFNANPLELKRSVGFFRHNLVFYFAIEFLMQANMTDDPVESFYEVGIETLLTLIYIGIILAFNKSLYGYIQVASAFLLCQNVVAVSIIPVLVWLTITENTLSYYVLALLLMWIFALITYIIKRVLAINLPAGLTLSVFYFIFAYFGAFAFGQMM